MASHHLLGTAVEVADLAWDAFEFRHRQKESLSAKADQQKRCLQLEHALERQRSENQHLQAAIDEYQRILQDIQKLPPDSSSHMPNFEICPSDLHERLIKMVESPAFMDKLQILKQNLERDDPATMEIEGDILVNSSLDDKSRWLWVPEDATPTKREEKCSLDDENYILVTEEDVVEGIALLVAGIVAANPQSKNLTPEQLQSTISSVFDNRNQTNIIHKLLAAGKVMYTAASWGLALYGLYTQRHIIKLATKAVVKSGRIVMMAL